MTFTDSFKERSSLPGVLGVDIGSLIVQIADDPGMIELGRVVHGREAVGLSEVDLPNFDEDSHTLQTSGHDGSMDGHAILLKILGFPDEPLKRKLLKIANLNL